MRLERPSELGCFRVLARAIETGDRAGWHRLDPASFNTDWAYWEAEKAKEKDRYQGSGNAGGWCYPPSGGPA